MGLLPSIYGQPDTVMLRLRIKADQQLSTKIDNDLAQYKTEAINKFINAKEEYTDVQVSIEARKKLKSKITLNEYYNGLTPESKIWFEQFYNNTKPSSSIAFNAFLTVNGEKAILAIQETLKQSAERKRTGNLLIDSSYVVPQPVSTSTSTPSFASVNNDPVIRNIDGSKIILELNFDGEKRYIISNPVQSIYLRGMRAPIGPYCYPYYTNVFCDACCGPAAGQSILEWFNVPVYGGQGELLTTTNSIQRRLANLMETTDGIDYTHPDDLYRTLTRDEFLGNKGFCYKEGDASFAQLQYMLSSGTPVILLIAKDDWAHYITVYGYNNLTKVFYCANYSNGEVSYSHLDDLWSFASTDFVADCAYSVTGVFSNTLFSYCPDGCDQTYEYNINLGNMFAQPLDAYSTSSKYYGLFNSTFVENQNEAGRPLNFYSIIAPSIPSFDLHAKVNSSDVNLYLGNDTKVITRPGTSNNTLINNSLGAPLNIKAYVNKKFLDTYPEVYCGFNIIDANNNTIWSDVKAFANYSLFVTPGDDVSCYEFDFSQPYNPGIKLIEFNLHGGFRKIIWNLSGCTNDMDQDFICDEFDLDVDGDGIVNNIDNCPLINNPEQTDNDNNGKGLECDASEKCLVTCNPQYYQVAESARTACYLKCSRRIDPRFPIDILERLVELQLWGDMPDPGDPQFERSNGYRSIKRNIDRSLRSTNLNIPDEQVKQLIREISRVKKDRPDL